MSDDPDVTRVVRPTLLLGPSHDVYIPLGQAQSNDIFCRNYRFLGYLCQVFYNTGWRPTCPRFKEGAIGEQKDQT